MKIDGLESIAAEIGIRNLAPLQPTPRDEFGTWLQGEIQALDTELKTADRVLREFAVGETRSIHHVMLSLEKARLTFELAVQVRNRILESYQEVMRMQV